MGRRLELQKLLSAIDGPKKVYFQPPESVKMEYPCIRYSVDSDYNYKANNELYSHRTIYTLTVIDKNPDSKIPDRLREIPYCRFDRAYTADNLNHWVFTIYF